MEEDLDVADSHSAQAVLNHPSGQRGQIFFFEKESLMSFENLRVNMLGMRADADHRLMMGRHFKHSSITTAFRLLHGAFCLGSQGSGAKGSWRINKQGCVHYIQSQVQCFQSSWKGSPKLGPAAHASTIAAQDGAESSVRGLDVALVQDTAEHDS